jgi:molybdopterin/thiamine biosynthesis adenylyltransferase/uncharacterized cupredoxin-like copper-binding protein
MATPPERFARIASRVKLSLLEAKYVIVVGVGSVGSQITRELANSGVGRLFLFDGDNLEESNLVRHALPSSYVGMNKAEALEDYLKNEIPTLEIGGLPWYINDDFDDLDIQGLLSDADLIVAATGDRDCQRRIGRAALALDIPAVFPALWENNFSEVFVQRDARTPCFTCWDGFRTEGEALDRVTALNADILGVIQLTIYLIFELLDRESASTRLLASRPGVLRPQLFIRNDFVLSIRPVPRRPNCPSCAVGPAFAPPTELPPQPPPSQPAVPRPTPRHPRSAPPESSAPPFSLPSTPSPPSPVASSGISGWVIVLALIFVAGLIVHFTHSSPGAPTEVYTPQEAFTIKCGRCHKLAAAEAGPLKASESLEAYNASIRNEAANRSGPDLDHLSPPEALLLNAIEEGRNRGLGYMPAHLLSKAEAQRVASYVARVELHHKVVLPKSGTSHIETHGSQRVLELNHNPEGYLLFMDDRATITAGNVVIRSDNRSGIEHDLVISGPATYAKTPGRSYGVTTLRLQLRPGKYEYYCDIPGHRAAGEHGILTVVP